MQTFKNAKLFTEDFTYKICSFSIENGKFVNITENPSESAPNAIDLHFQKVIPGVIDIHTHGNSNQDFSDGNLEGLKIITKYLAKNGITSFCPTSLTLPYAQLKKAYQNALELKVNPEPKGSKIIGIDMEGPFFNPKKKGAQNPEYLKLPDFEAFKELYDSCNGLIKIVCIAPELEGAYDFIKKAKDLSIISIGHTVCDYTQAKQAINEGAREVTHLFNAMNGIKHREPGPVIAALEDKNVFVQLITDGHHVDPSIIRFTFNVFGKERVMIISDSLRCCGCPDGEFDLGGQKCFLKDGVAELSDGTLAGSCTNCFECMRRAIKYGIKEEDAIRAATYNPSKHLKIDNEVGQIKVGLSADFVITDEDLNVHKVYIKGNEI